MAPVFEEIKAAMDQRGVPFEIEETSVRDPKFSAEPKTYVIRLTLKHAEPPAHMECFGDFESLTLRISENPKGGRCLLGPPMTLSEAGREFIEDRTDRFVRTVLGL